MALRCTLSKELDESVGIIYYMCLYLEAAVATVFEIATFPLAKILHSRSIKNVFSVFENFVKKEKKN